jgi:hypothetical protein
MSTTLEPQLEKMLASPPIDLADVSFEFTSTPEQLIVSMGDTWRYDGIVERRTGGAAGFESMIRTLVPSSSEPDSDLGLYLPIWRSHELPHAEIAYEAQRSVGLTPTAELPDKLPASAHLVGAIVSEFPWLEAVAEGVVATQATRNEKMTLDHYRIEKRTLVGLGENDFVETAVNPMIEQEALHLGWNRQKLREIVSRLSQAQLRLVVGIDRAIWQPVGAKEKSFRPHLALAIEELTAGEGDQVGDMSEKVQAVVDNIVSERLPGRKKQQFVAERIGKIFPMAA